MPNFLTADFFAPLAADHRLIAYFIIFAAMIIEGEGALLFLRFWRSGECLISGMF